MTDEIRRNILHRILSRLRLLSIELLVVLIAFFAALFSVLFLIRLIFWQQKLDFDMRVFAALGKIVNPTLTHVMEVVTFFGSHYFLIPANLLLIGYGFFVKKDKWFAVKIASVALGSLILMVSLKHIFQRARPLIPLLDKAAGLSFPSGHAFMSFAFFGLLIYFIHHHYRNKRLRIFLMLLCLLFTFLIGFSRIYLRVHFASDVIAGICLSLLWLVIALRISHRLETNQNKLPELE
jgi:undecaprenyl-diphosphatase